MPAPNPQTTELSEFGNKVRLPSLPLFARAKLLWGVSHTVEELQHFTRLHTPIGPSSHVVRLAVPQSCCEEAARVLVRAFGGEREARRVVGGVRWWQVRPGDSGYVVASYIPRVEEEH